MNAIRIGNHTVENHGRVFIVAELSANHNQNYETAVNTIRAAAECGADAIKLQTYTADTLTIDCTNEYFQIRQGTVWDGKTFYQLYKEAYTPWEWQPELKNLAESLGLVFFSSPFDPSAVDFLEKLEVPAYKVASFEITDIPLIEYIASFGKPVIISTGIATLADIHEAVNACRRMGNSQIVLLKCTSAYPAPMEESNLKTIPNLSETFGVPSGLSDHSLGSTNAIAAVALGACFIEKHFILDRGMGGPDVSFSMEPAEFKHMVGAIRDTEKALGTVSYDLSAKVKKNRDFARSLFAVQDIAAGDEFTHDNIKSIRPGFGLHPRYLKDIIGKKARKKIVRGTPLDWSCIG